MQVEYFVSTDGQCPPRGQQRVPAISDGWLTSLAREAASLRQELDLRSSEGIGKNLLNANGVPKYLRLPTTSPASPSLHNFRFSLGLPSQVVLPSPTPKEVFLPQKEEEVVSQNPLIRKYFPFVPREALSFDNTMIPSAGEGLRWSLAEDRALIYLDSTFQALTEGYLSLQQKFPRLFTKTTAEWAALRQVSEKAKRELDELACEAVDMADPETLRDRKLRSAIIDMLPRSPDFSAPDAVFKRRLQEIKSNTARHKLLLSLPEDPSIFVPVSQSDDTKTFLPQPKQREPTVEERREALREALFGGRVDSKEARSLLDSSPVNGVIACPDGNVPCNTYLIASAAPCLGRQLDSQSRLDGKFVLNPQDDFWDDQSVGDAFSEKVVRKFVSLCHQPGLLPRVSEMRRQRNETQSLFDAEYSNYMKDVSARKEDALKSLEEERRQKARSTARVFKDMLAEDVNVLTRIYRQHVSKALDQIESEISFKKLRVSSHFEEEVGYLELAKSYFMPPELKSLNDQLCVVEDIVNKDFFSSSDLPQLLRLSEVLQASGVRTQVLQAMATAQMPIRNLIDTFSKGISENTIKEFLAMLSDRQFIELYEAERSGNISSQSLNGFSESSKLQRAVNESVYRTCVRNEWSTRLEAKRQEIRRMTRDEIAEALKGSLRGSGTTGFECWRELLTSAVTSQAGSQSEKLVILHEGGGKGVLSASSRGVFDINLCSAGLPLHASTVSAVRIGDSARSVYFEVAITSAFLPEVFPFSVHIGLEPVPRCLNHIQLLLAKEHAARQAEELLRSQSSTKVSSDFREDQHTRYFGPSRQRTCGKKSGMSGVHAVDVSVTQEELLVHGCGWSSDGLLYANGVAHCVQEGFTVGDSVGVALNLLTGQVQYFKNGRKMHFTGLLTGREIAYVLRSAVAFKPSVSLQSTATRNPVHEEEVVEGVINSLLQTSASSVKGSLSHQEVLSLRLSLSEPFSCKNEGQIGFAQFIEM